MEKIRANSHKSYSHKSKFPVMLTKKFPIEDNSQNFLQYRNTPEPSLTVRHKTIHKRILHSPNAHPDKYNKQTNETLSNLIKNNAITFISPHDLINQIHNDSLTQPPTRELKKRNSETCSIQKISNSSESNNVFNHYELYQDYKINKSSVSYYNDKKIEVTGFQIPKIIRSNYIRRSEQQSKSGTSQVLSLYQNINTRKSYKPVVVYNKNHNYFRSSKHGDNFVKFCGGSYYFPSS